MIQPKSPPDAAPAKKHDMGRPAKPPDEKASARINVRVTKGRHSKYHEAAEREGKRLTDWIVEKLDRSADSTLKKRR